MSNELAIVNNLMNLSVMPKEEIKRAMDRSYLAGLVRQHPTLDQGAFIDFINKCQLTGADPRINQVYLLVHNSWNADKGVSEPKGTTVFAYQFFIQVAQKTGELEGFGVDTASDTYIDLGSGQERKSITATAWCKRNGCRYEYKARFWEFAKTNRQGQLSGNWKVSPYLMLEKCAIANVMRWAFPEALTGIYTDEEIAKDEHEKVKINPFTIEQKPQQIPERPKPITEYMPKEVEPSEEKLEVTVVQEKKKEERAKIDFADRDIEDIRSELLDFVKNAPDLLFERIGKPREYIVDKVVGEKTLDGIKQKYSIIMQLI